jgi:hypothetical protein
MWEPGKDGGEIREYAPSEIISVELPLVKIRGRNGETIINTSSIAFVSASEV